ncbi:DUF6255 family natural product biosynthesis protein [Streptomyces sp. ISL-11]|uniref:DUF6255 family natural product biosynthesis protein n=1 Tax=Streptomyces sp. ISL-11 TaxID=2819174 RepID=UPI001BE9B6A8|nr:DUF6255 family natural product biosynthesis protein [Streptomyces sp. ISL-11]MBT2384901.1 hypothetical protein [Streptomyces sp. ISL-11]
MSVRAKECRHQAGWSHGRGESRCQGCGVVRFTDYGAVRPTELPQTVVPGERARHADRAAAQWLAQAAQRAVRLRRMRRAVFVAVAQTV